MKHKTFLFVIMILVIGCIGITGCGKSNADSTPKQEMSEAEKSMKDAIKSATDILNQDGKPYDPSTEDTLKKAIASSKDAKDDAAFTKVAEEVNAAAKAYSDSVAQMKQVTNPEESFLVERAKTIESVTDVEAATEETDGNNMMNKPGGYTSYVAMKSSLVKDDTGYYKDQSPVEAGTDGGAVIEAFPTVEDAEKRCDYLASLDGSGPMSPGTHVVVGTLVVRTSNDLTATNQKELEKRIIDALLRLE